MQGIKTKYDQTKICDAPLYKDYSTSQEIFSVVSIDDSGIFELPGNKFSKLYKLSDINFAGVTDEEKKSIIIAFSRIIKTIPSPL